MSQASATGKGLTTWAVTGPIGAGKSALSSILAERGAAVVDGDRLGHELLGRPDIQAAIAARLGQEYITDGQVDRALLGRRVFAEPAAMAILSDITHGPLAELAADRLAAVAAGGEHELAVFEAAVYFLLPSPPPVDLVVAVVAAPELRVQRLLARAGGRLTVAEAEARVAAQKSLAEMCQQADEIIVNNGTRAELEAQALRLAPWLRPGSGNLP